MYESELINKVEEGKEYKTEILEEFLNDSGNMVHIEPVKGIVFAKLKRL